MDFGGTNGLWWRVNYHEHQVIMRSKLRIVNLVLSDLTPYKGHGRENVQQQGIIK